MRLRWASINYIKYRVTTSEEEKSGKVGSKIIKSEKLEILLTGRNHLELFWIEQFSKTLPILVLYTTWSLNPSIVSIQFLPLRKLYKRWEEKKIKIANAVFERREFSERRRLQKQQQQKKRKWEKRQQKTKDSQCFQYALLVSPLIEVDVKGCKNSRIWIMFLIFKPPNDVVN